MSKKIIQPTPLTKTFLIKEKKEFQEELEKRIELGKEILSMTVPRNESIARPTYRLIKIVEYDEKLKKDFIAKHERWNNYNIELLRQFFNNAENEYKTSYVNKGQDNWFGEDIINEHKEVINRQITYLESLIEQIPLIPAQNNITNEKQTLESDHINNSKVFIVHGHDDGIKNEVARFIETLGYEAIILHEQASQGKTIIEKIEQYTDVGFAIVLYTPCDIGAQKDDANNLRKRARQNVVFEHGYLTSKLGRSKVCALVKDEIETPGDISGVIYIKKDDADSWKIQIAKEMKSVGYNIDFNKIM